MEPELTNSPCSKYSISHTASELDVISHNIIDDDGLNIDDDFDDDDLDIEDGITANPTIVQSDDDNDDDHDEHTHTGPVLMRTSTSSRLCEFQDEEAQRVSLGADVISMEGEGTSPV